MGTNSETPGRLSFFDANVSFGRPEVPSLKVVETADELVAEMDFVGVDEALVWHSSQVNLSPVDANRMAIELTRDHPKLHPTWAILPHQTNELGAPKAFYEAMGQAGVRAIWLRPSEHRWLPTRTGIGAMLDLAVERKVPAFIQKTDWLMIERLLTDFPGLRLVCVGSGSWGEDRYFRPLMERYEALYFELSRYELADGIRELVERYGHERLLFGSAYPAWSMGGPMMDVATADVSLDARRAIAGDNLRRLLSEANL